MALSIILRRSASRVISGKQRHYANLILPGATLASFRPLSSSPSLSSRDNDSMVTDLVSKIQSLRRNIEALRKSNDELFASSKDGELFLKGKGSDDSLIKIQNDESVGQGGDEVSLVEGKGNNLSPNVNCNERGIEGGEGEDELSSESSKKDGDESVTESDSDDEGDMPLSGKDRDESEGDGEDENESTLIKEIRSQISRALDFSRSSKVTVIPETFPFEIDDREEYYNMTRSIILRQNYQGNHVKVKVKNPTPHFTMRRPEFNELKTCSFSMDLTVRVKKFKGTEVEFICTAIRDHVFICRAKPTGNYEVNYSDLDEKLKEEFQRYLEARGITPATTNFLYEYMLDRANSRNMRILQKLKGLLD